MPRHFLADLDVTALEQAALLRRAQQLKTSPHRALDLLRGRVLGMIFQKSSTRTRVSFEAGMHQLGGHAIFLTDRDNQLGRGESISDTGRVLSRYVDALLIRTYAHATAEDLARHSRVPVINGLDDLLHPCQGLADLLTLQEHFGRLAGLQVVFIGDGNNMAHSLLCAGALAGVHVRVICPPSHAPRPALVEQARAHAPATTRIEVAHDPAEVAGAHAVVTDVWTPMGREAEQQERRTIFAPYQVDAARMAQAGADAIFMHCLPARRGEEVTAEVIDGPRSRVFMQAENRMHVQKALLLFLLGEATPAVAAAGP